MAATDGEYDVLQSYIAQTENKSQLRVACSECTCTVSYQFCDNIPHWITSYLKLSSVCKHIKA
jgi:hypothetical protein